MLNYAPMVQALLHLCPQADIRIVHRQGQQILASHSGIYSVNSVSSIKRSLDPDTVLEINIPTELATQTLLDAIESLANACSFLSQKTVLPHMQSSAAHILLDYLLRADSEESLPNALLLAQQAGIDLSVRRYLCIMECSAALQATPSRADRFGLIRERIQRVFQQNSPVLFKEYNSHQLLFCISCEALAKAKVHACLSSIQQELAHEFGAICPIGVSFCIIQPEDYKDAFSSAQAALQLSLRPHMDTVVFIEEHWLEYDISKIDPDTARGYLMFYIEALRSDRQLLQTAQTFIRSEMNYSIAASSLYMHKNTFINHMRSLKEKLGLDPLRSDSDCILLEMVLHFLREDADDLATIPHV